MKFGIIFNDKLLSFIIARVKKNFLFKIHTTIIWKEIWTKKRIYINDKDQAAE